MKKSQRSRLAALRAKSQADLSEDEKKELQTLEALAAQYPDETKDEDDTATAAAPTGLRAAVAKALHGLRNPNNVAADLVAARAQVATITTERDTARADVTARDTTIAAHVASISALTAQVATFAAFFGLKPAELTGKDSAALTALLAEKVSAQAAEQLAGAGVPQAQLPKVTQTEAAADTYDGIVAQMAAEKDPVKLGQLAAKANALRNAQWSALAGGKN
jgi:hypothetical protein